MTEVLKQEDEAAVCVQAEPRLSGDAVADAGRNLLSLPIDALHGIASFLSPHEWCNCFGIASKSTHTVSLEIVRRVRRHAFACATQVVVAHETGETEDARQLAALYCSRGIPIYAGRCLGHALDTVVWRMRKSGGTAAFRSGATYLEEKAARNVGSKIRIHKHLLDQHKAGNTAVSETDTETPSLSLSADFLRKQPEIVELETLLASPKPPTFVMGSVELDVYSTENSQERFDSSSFLLYQRRLEACLIKNDTASLEECMLDFWDQFFPETAGVHYFDTSTAVPRVSHLERFLSQPCPEAWGTVQCEIERIRVAHKGRLLFPVYEYRLFIRHDETRRDTLLMVAKHKGRKQHEGKKGGSNNYYLFLPQQGDVDGHFQQAHKTEDISYCNGPSRSNVADEVVMLGRLQSNFIGTEFQIFTPPAGSTAVKEEEDSGAPRRTNRRAIASHDALYLCEDGGIQYTANLLGSRPRIMDVCIPKVAGSGEAGVEWRAYLEGCEGDDCLMLPCLRQLLANEEEDHEFGLVALQNRPPWWNADLGSFVLNFGGRVSVASVKNFQLCERTNHESVKLQFGRIKGRHSFTMDFQHPLTAVQAFSIAISSLQSKISFG